MLLAFISFIVALACAFIYGIFLVVMEAEIGRRIGK